mmetsp:Transcript_43269/g.135468  ORF Transcript_43269/g.135468 Transcript_43269/m.135468 type:complete len:345 (-) Transcript_43269:132-1166(-)|eukprot:CAMPEP_0118888368 /NCGR_PEP_ID=MMETSP1163-20130328/25684_1 /TAXON_ID=124430 /ORGANISM="Phaeomonas parva, Strain CCMP2877" /LENGTH=344 /DNA_ID=CAMNT_0006826931 /DNA_START=207 /DNA_END=1241 /DNA_ORIENTATION=-
MASETSPTTRRAVGTVVAAAALGLIGMAAVLQNAKEEAANVTVTDHRRLSVEDGRWFRARSGPCKHAFIDLGANVGDVLSAMANNLRKDMTGMGMRMDAATGQWVDGHGKQPTRMEAMFGTYLEKVNARPHDVCMVGIEGNPTFTASLRNLEAALRKEVTPHVDIATESVVSNEDGRTTLYLDTINPDKNFWGSSIADTSVNVVCGKDAKSKYWDMFKGKHFYDKAEAVDCDKARADVDSVKLTTLIRSYISDEDAHNGDSLLIVKMDVEGAEYPVLDEIVKSGVACAYAGLGNHFVLFYEEHRNSLQGAFAEYRGKVYRENLDALTACGVKIFEGERLASHFS